MLGEKLVFIKNLTQIFFWSEKLFKKDTLIFRYFRLFFFTYIDFVKKAHTK